jgi:hypothetical protein
MPLLSRARSNSMIAQKRSRVTRVVKSRISMVAKPIPRRMKEFNCKPLMCHDPPHPAPYVIGGGEVLYWKGTESLK